MKKLFPVILAALLLTCTACGGSASSSAASTASTSTASQTQSAPAQSEPAAAQSTADTDLTLESLKNYPVTDSSKFSVKEVDGGVAITGCTAEDDVVVVPDTIDGKTVVKIAKYGMGNGTMKGIVLPDTVTSLGYGAFNGCENLLYIDLGNGVETIGQEVFNGCISLKTLVIPKSVKKIGLDLINYNNSLGDVIIPETVEEIENNCLGTTSGSENVVIVTPAGSVAEEAAKLCGFPVRND